jgi:hypothetical protein
VSNRKGGANGVDVVYMPNVLKSQNQVTYTCAVAGNDITLTCYVVADNNGDCSFNGIDVTYAMDYFKGRHPYIRWCPDFTPGAP